ncbi:aminotransferase A [Peribacillus frigoritolerans]|uniref:aminotransferase A n=1 Tax=Peribacillus frigoritolerans TaxID=450367 RepID=UPI000BEE7902|nr:aminotransferase A [Peribacillus frigoritolerans]MBD8134227.1 aminotransferase A [Bacillus sp. CFBP 13597]MED3835624.1 aminotransferase A [Peribacillus frigoritolerans]MED3847722.1 aminotransferase A [Peribacillus frigoritolerans]PEF39207.1 aromatic amino acid aminotransferase [Bacillus sp. AFS094228]
MEHLINPLVKDVQISGIRKFYNMVADIEGTLSLTIGQPDFPTPTHIKEAAKQAINNDYTVYTHNAGYLELREAASNYVKDKYKLDYDPANEVIVTSGASEGIDIAFRTILIPGNEVILPGPVYPGYEPIIKMCGATPVYADTTKNGFRLTADILEKYITENTRCIVLPYPSNPTGVTLTAEELLDIAELVKGKDIFILADEIYSELVFDQEHVSIATFLKEQTIVLNGLSKSHSMTGWRIGLLFAPAAISQHLLKVHQYNVTCAASISQRAALEALTAGRNDAIPMKTEYARRREYVYSRLQAMKLEIVKPNGAFYFFIKLPEGYASSLDFCLKLVQQEKVAVVPGDAFSPLGEGYFRISYAYSMETLEKALDRIEAFLAKK